MKEKVTSGFVIATKADESEPDILVDELHPCVCPNCGISKFEEGHEKDIVYDDFDCDSISTRCWGGFGEKRYKYLPHKCKACGTVFAPWTVEKKVNGEVIGYFIGLIFSVSAAISTTVVSAAIDEPILLLGTVVALIFMTRCIAGIEDSTCSICDPEKQISDELKYAEITGKYLEDDDIEEEETEDLDVTFGVNTQQAANTSEPKSAMEVFDTLTPEQKSVAYYLMGSAAERMNGIMNDVWRVDL